MGITHAKVSTKDDGTDSSRVLASDWNANHVVSGLGMVLLEQHTASSSASLDFTSFISSTYDVYQFDLFDIMPATNAVMLYMRVHISTGWVSASKYASAGWVWIYNAQAPFGNSVGAQVGQITTSNATDTSNTNGFVRGTVKLFNPQSSQGNKQVEFHIGWHESSAQEVKGSTGFASYLDTPAVDGFQFLFSSGAIASGTIRVYGIPK